MPRADPIVKKGVYNRREKITIDGLTATRAHHQTLKRQSMKKKHIDKAEVKRIAAGKAIPPQSRLFIWLIPANLASLIAAAQNTGSNDSIPRQLQPAQGIESLAHQNALDLYHDYKSESLVKLEYDEAWAAAVAKVSGGLIETKKEDIEEESVKEESVKEESVKEESVKEESVKEEGVKEEGRGHRERHRERRQALPHRGPRPLERTS